MILTTLKQFIYILIIPFGTLTVAGYSSENNNKQDHSSVHRQITQIIRENSTTISFNLDSAKCGLPLMFEIIKNWNNLSEKQKDQIRSLLAAPTMQKSRIIGNFQIHYDTTGINEPALLDNNFQRIQNTAEAYIDSVGKYFNQVWLIQVDSLGYDAPIFRLGLSNYEIYIEELGGSLYGATYLRNQIGNYSPPRYSSHIEIDNDFNLHYSRGMAGLKVTAAHEFHHAIQLSGYGYRDPDLYLYEITSTWMEDVLYTEVNDYYNYLKAPNGVPKGHFASPATAFTYTNSNIEYSRAIWGKFIEKRYSKDVMRNAWEFMRSMQSVPALDSALKIPGSSFKEAFLDWTIWNYNTGLHADTINYYSEGNYYPQIRQQDTVQYTSPSTSFSKQVQAISSIYYPVKIGAHTMRVAISNLDVLNPYSPSFYDFSYEMRDSGDQTFKHLTNGLYVRLNVSIPSNWISHESVDIVTDFSPEVIPQEIVLAQNFPNPFNPTTTIKFNIPKKEFITLKIYNILGEEITTLIEKEVMVGEHSVIWNATGQPSGIYFCRMRTSTSETIKKLILLR